MNRRDLLKLGACAAALPVISSAFGNNPIANASPPTRTFGRLIEHDERSRAYPAMRAAEPQSVLHRHYAPVLDQLDLGMCTGAALAQCLNASQFAPARPRRRYLNIGDAKRIYSLATKLDAFPGDWPPMDTGSSTLAAAKAGKKMGLLDGYTHAFGFEHFARALQLQPVVVGTRWYTEMMTPDANGYVRPLGWGVGGHAYTAIGIDYATETVTFLNSWGKEFGRNGRFLMRFEDVDELLDGRGEVTVPLVHA